MTTSSSKQSLRFSFIKAFHKKDSPFKCLDITRYQANPVHIPEILEKILSYLDDHTSRKIARLVCRQWFFMTSPSRQVVFDGHRHGRTINKTLSRISGAGGLWWRSDHDYWLKPPPQRVHWGFLKKALQLVHERYQDQERQLQQQQQHQQQDQQLQRQSQNSYTQDDQNYIDRTRTKLYSPLRTLELVENPRVSYLISDILPYMSTLTVLRICPTTGESFDMNEILISCPLLEVFHLLPTEKLRVFGPWDVMTKLRNLQKQASPGQQHPRAQLPLQSLILRNVLFYQSCIEELLNYTPRLTELQLVVWSPDEDSTFDPPQFYQHLQSLDHITLDSFHFSFEGKFDDNTPELKEMAKRICPNRHKWLFWTGDLTPAMTTLSPRWSSSTTSPSSAVPMDSSTSISAPLHNSCISAPAIPPTCLTIWTCISGLSCTRDTTPWIHSPPARVMDQHVQEYGPAEDYEPSTSPLTAKQTAFSLHLFGRGNAGSPLRLTLQSGFCLLARLKYLEKLRIGCDGGTVDCQRGDIEWMIPSGQSARKVEERRKVVAGWTEQLADEERMEGKRTKRLSTVKKVMSTPSATSFVDIWSQAEPGLKEELQNLGRLLDVKKMLDEMGSSEFRCWPYIQKVAFHRPIEMGLSPERELKEMFPVTTLSGVRLRLAQRSYPVP
ncbi:hypothetical protein BGX24_012745 [Mortierella sp. AD032]|nr:hypothetical protein BGX24_012745 [Mortierella sp. AD032]